MCQLMLLIMAQRPTRLQMQAQGQRNSNHTETVDHQAMVALLVAVLHPPLYSQVSSLATELRHRYNGQVAVVDDGTEHPHRLSLTMKSDISDRVTQKWSDALKEKGVKVNCCTVSCLGGGTLYVRTCFLGVLFCKQTDLA